MSRYYCENCKSEIYIQDKVWISPKYGCPICGTDDAMEFIPDYETPQQVRKAHGEEVERGGMEKA